jgi:hypothetical protein
MDLTSERPAAFPPGFWPLNGIRRRSADRSGPGYVRAMNVTVTPLQGQKLSSAPELDAPLEGSGNAERDGEDGEQDGGGGWH